MSIHYFLRTCCGRQVNAIVGTTQRLWTHQLSPNESSRVLREIVAPSVSIIQVRGFKKKIHIPKTLKPLNFDDSGDLVEQEKLDLKQTHYLYKDFEELKTAPEHVKKLFTLEFASGPERLQHRHLTVQDRISKVTGPAHSLEKEIGYMTVKIQNMKPYIVSRRMDKKEKAHLIHRIRARNKVLRYLRTLDYDRYSWLTKDLQVKYQPVPQYNRRESHRACERRLIRQEAAQLRSQKLHDLKERLEEEKEAFYKHKRAILEEIEAEIEEYDLSTEKITEDYKTLVSSRGEKLQNEYRWKNRQPGKFAQYYAKYVKH